MYCHILCKVNKLAKDDSSLTKPANVLALAKFINFVPDRAPRSKVKGFDFGDIELMSQINEQPVINKHAYPDLNLDDYTEEGRARWAKGVLNEYLEGNNWNPEMLVEKFANTEARDVFLKKIEYEINKIYPKYNNEQKKQEQRISFWTKPLEYSNHLLVTTRERETWESAGYFISNNMYKVLMEGNVNYFVKSCIPEINLKLDKIKRVLKNMADFIDRGSIIADSDDLATIFIKLHLKDKCCKFLEEAEEKINNLSRTKIKSLEEEIKWDEDFERAMGTVF